MPVIRREEFTHKGKVYEVETRTLDNGTEVLGFEVQAMCDGRPAGWRYSV